MMLIYGAGAAGKMKQLVYGRVAVSGHSRAAQLHAAANKANLNVTALSLIISELRPYSPSLRNSFSISNDLSGCLLMKGACEKSVFEAPKVPPGVTETVPSL